MVVANNYQKEWLCSNYVLFYEYSVHFFNFKRFKTIQNFILKKKIVATNF